MTILSWNLYFLNERQDEAFAFLRDSAYDVYCLQEVPPAFLARLTTLPLGITYATEIALMREGEATRTYSVILSRYPVTEPSVVELPNRDLTMPARGRVFIGFMYASGLWKRTTNLGLPREVAVATVIAPSGPVRVASVHLSLTNPAWRREELALILARIDGARPAIIAGDLNIIETFPVSVINYLLGGTAIDALWPRRERNILRQMLAERGFANPLAGMQTHAISRSQLDHILVSSALRATAVHVVPESYGSDHNPVALTLA